MDRLKNKRVFLGKNSKEVQEKIFKLGFKYPSGSTEFNFKDPFLFFDSYGEVYSSGDLEFFNNHEYEEVTPEYILNLKNKPKWEDFGEMKGCYVNDLSEVETILKCKSNSVNKNLFPTKEEAEACLALSQLCQWRDKYNDGWRPDWGDNNSQKHYINYYNNEINKDVTYLSQKPLVFKSAEIRDKFIEDFRDLIEQAKPLL